MDVLFDSYFELSHVMTEHHRVVFSLIELLAQIGGFFGSIVGLVYILASILTRNFLLHKIATAIYFVKKPDDEGHSHKPGED